MEGFNRVDAAIGYSAEPWNVTLAVNNLTNKEYWRSDSMRAHHVMCYCV